MSSDTVQEVLDADERRCQALVANDFDALARILHDELVYTHSNATSDSKDGLLDNVRSGKVKYRALRRDNVTVRIFGDTARMNGHIVLETTRDGVETVRDIVFLSVWVKTAGSWQMAAWASTPIPVH
ncbi:MAG: nuclear transport factor 2 family protein [Chloroflexota bacterium]